MNQVRFILLLIATLLLSCGKVDPPAQTPKTTARITVLCIGGLSDDCTLPIYTAIKERCQPDVDVIQIAPKDAYRVDVDAYLKANPPGQKLVLIGHSWGTNRAAVTASNHHTSLAVMIDPVAWHGDMFALPADVEKCFVYYRSQAFGPVTASVFGPVTQTKTIQGDHGSICFNAELIGEIVEAVNGL